MKNQENLEQKKCGESCECKTVNDLKKEEIKVEEKVEHDPTRFGDWQVNGRAIDF
jgi:hypothetical protein